MIHTKTLFIRTCEHVKDPKFEIVTSVSGFKIFCPTGQMEQEGDEEVEEAGFFAGAAGCIVGTAGFCVEVADLFVGASGFFVGAWDVVAVVNGVGELPPLQLHGVESCDNLLQSL
jgi:hypothetical protein